MEDEEDYQHLPQIILSAIFFLAKVSHIKLDKEVTKDIIGYKVNGQLFFASTLQFVDSFDFSTKAQTVYIDFSNSKVWDESAVDAIDKVISKYKNNNVKVHLSGLSNECSNLINRISIHK